MFKSYLEGNSSNYLSAFERSLKMKSQIGFFKRFKNDMIVYD